jgi:signal peptidase I
LTKTPPDCKARAMSETPQISADSAEPDAAPERIDVQRELLDFGKFLLTFALIVYIIRSLFISSFNIPSESMQPRLLIGDYLIVNKAAYGWTRHSLPFSWPLIPGRVLGSTPERGDVVVFKHPLDNVDYIKRVIGLPGDRIQLVDGIVRINDVPVPRRQITDLVIPATENMVEASFGNPCFRAVFEEMRGGQLYCRYPQYVERLPNGRTYPVLDLTISDADTTGVYEVPDGSLFLMGDNRDRSYDSRFPATVGGGIGIVPENRLVGEAWVTIFATDGSAVWYNPLSWFAATRWERIGEGF